MTNATHLYAGLGYVAMNVTDLARSADFYEHMVGLEVVARTPSTVALRCGPAHHDVLLCAAEHAGLRRCAWRMASLADLESARSRFTDIGLDVVDLLPDEAAELSISTAFRIRDPAAGVCHEFFADMTTMAKPYAAPLVQIQRLGHVVLRVAKYADALEFALRHMNFRLSDQVSGFAAWLRCFPNSLHHSLAMQKSELNGLHHVNFMVTSIDDIGRAVNRFREHEVPIVFGPGRHVPSTSIFLYFLDPDGLTLEYSFGMEEFPRDGARTPRMLEFNWDIVDMWGGRPDPRFGSSGHID